MAVKTTREYGFDIGTKTIGVAFFDEATRKVELLDINEGGKDDQAKKILPSVIAFSLKDKSFTYGRDAELKEGNEGYVLIHDIKRYLLCRWESQDKQDNILVNKGGWVAYKLGDSVYTTEQLYNGLIGHVIEKCIRCGHSIGRVVVTVPNNFGDEQRRLVKKIFTERLSITDDCCSVVVEPTAAIMGLEDKMVKNPTAVFDYGGGTLDISIATITKNNSVEDFDIMSHEDKVTGGTDIDKAIYEHLVQMINDEDVEVESGSEDDLSSLKEYITGNVGKNQLMKFAEELKINMGMDPKIFTAKRVKYSFNIDEKDIEEWITHLIDEAVESMVNANEDFKKKHNSSIGSIVLVGGTSQIPLVMKKMKEKFPDVVVTLHPQPLFAVASGAALYKKKEKSVKEVSSYPVSVAMANTRLGMRLTESVIPKNEPLPTTKVYNIEFTANNQKEVCLVLYKLEGRKILRATECMGTITVKLQPGVKRGQRAEFIVTMDTEGYIRFTFKYKVRNNPMTASVKFNIGN